NDREGAGVTYNSLANHYHQLGNYAEAGKYYRLAAGYFRPASLERSWIYLSCSINSMKKKEYTDALDFARKSKVILDRIPDGARSMVLERKIRIQLAACYSETG